MVIFDWLNSFDTQLFLSLNGLHNPFFDAFFSWFTSKEVWFPFYFVLLILLYRKYKSRAIWVVLALILAIALSDRLSVMLKLLFHRYRPSHQPILEGKVHLTFLGKGGMFGFVSSHAANAFALTVFIGQLIKRKRVLITLLLWSVLTVYSRVYVGVHYPFDLLCGGILGALIGWGMYKVLMFIDKHKFRKEIQKRNRWNSAEAISIPIVLATITITLLIVAKLMVRYNLPF